MDDEIGEPGQVGVVQGELQVKAPEEKCGEQVHAELAALFSCCCVGSTGAGLRAPTAAAGPPSWRGCS